jgi:hypothetical protein
MPAAANTVPPEPFVKPIRIPDGVECGTAEPPVARAGERGSWLFRFVLSEAVPEGTRLGILFDGGRNVKGAFRPIQVSRPRAGGYVSLRRAGGAPIKPLEKAGAGSVLFDAPPGGLAAGEVLEARFGGRPGAKAPRLSLPSKMVLLVVPLDEDDSSVPAINAEAPKRIIGACLVHVTGAGLDHLRLYAPSQAIAGQPFDVLVRPEDAFSNVACERPGELLLRADADPLPVARDDQPHSACCFLRGVVLDRPGVQRLEVEDTSRGLRARSNPIRCATDAGVGHYWGMIHGHTEFSDGAGSMDHYFTYMRDQSGLDFGAAGDHDHVYETSDEMWRLTQEATARYNDPGRFVTLLGYEWAKWRQNGDGDRNVYYLHDHRPMVRSDNGHSPTPPDLYRALRSETAMVIPHHSANRGNHCDWKDYDPALDRLVEIFSEWGSSECGADEGNPYPMRPWPPGSDQPGEVPAGFVQRALTLGWRVGFTAGGDDHQGHPGDQTPRENKPSAGLLAVCASALTREAIWEALYSRRCYGTTGARIIVEFTLDGVPMGSELFLEDRPRLAQERRLSVTVHGTAALGKIEVIRNNEVVHTHAGRAEDESFEWTDTDAFGEIALPPAPHWPTPFAFYYVRVTQTDGEMAWVSPIWVSPRR